MSPVRALVTVLSLGLAGPALAQNARQPGLKLGLDNFAVRALKLKAPALIDYAASLRTDSLFISDLGPFEKTDDAYLGDLRKMAADKGLQIHLGSWSICPTSVRFRKDWGTAEEHLALGIRMAKALGSPVFRVVLGAGEDRGTPGGIEARIADTVKVLKSQRGLAIDSGVRITVENHAGDMTATELVGLIEQAGKDYVGANMDSGNALWTLDDPMDSLEKLGAYAASTSLRDGTVWETEKGCKVQWTAHGDGTACDLKAYFARYAQLCPGVPVNVETIGGFVVEFPYLDPSFWGAFPKKSGAEFAKFLSVAKRGKAIAQYDGGSKERQKQELEKSIRFLREEIGLGTK